MTRIHWLSPSLMLGSLFCGFAFALGHHFFYKSLDQQPAPTTFDEINLLGTNISLQQLNIAVGTAFAFLVRACLVFAVGIAYLQVTMRTLFVCKDDTMDISTMDVIVSALGNLIALAYLGRWWRNPVLYAIALAAWLLPIASIATPSTLSIATSLPPPSLLAVPRVDFNSLKLLAEMGETYSGGDLFRNLGNWSFIDGIYDYQGPTDSVRRIALATAAQGEIIQVPAPAANSTWNLTFPAPSLRCHPVSTPVQRLVVESIVNYTFADDDCNTGPGFTAWHPRTDLASLNPQFDLVPFRRSAVPDGKGDLGDNEFNNVKPGQYNDQALNVLIAVTPTLIKAHQRPPNLDYYETYDYCEIDATGGTKNSTFDQRVSNVMNASTVLRCDLYNSSYTTSFTFVNGAQHVATKIRDIGLSPLIRSLAGNFSDFEPSNGTTEGHSCQLLDEYKALYEFKHCTFNSEALSALSYQAVFHAAIDTFVGRVERGGWNLPSLFGDSSVQSTVLTESPELAFLRHSLTYTGDRKPSLQDIAISQNESILTGLGSLPTKPGNLSLRESIEELFQNITLSLMSSAELQPNTSSSFYPPLTEVHINMQQNVYSYAAYKLWLAYGLSIGVSVIMVSFGLVATFLNGASFSNDFSTFLRLSKGIQLSRKIEEQDLDGKDPLPEYLGSTTITFPHIRLASRSPEAHYDPMNSRPY